VVFCFWPCVGRGLGCSVKADNAPEIKGDDYRGGGVEREGIGREDDGGSLIFSL